MTALYPIPTVRGTPAHKGPWAICNGRGWIVADGFPTKHHAWRWIIGPSYEGPRRKWREPPNRAGQPRKKRGKWRHYATGRYREHVE